MAVRMRFLNKSYKTFLRSSRYGKYCTSTVINSAREGEYTSVPQYPPIEKMDPEAIEERNQKDWYDKIKRQETVEEKLFEVNVPRYWGWKCFMVNEGVVPYNNLVFSQHMTRTHLIETQTLPFTYSQYSEKSRLLAKQIKCDVIDAIEYQLDVRRDKLFNLEPMDRQNEMTKIIVTELNRVIMNRLWTDESHLKFIQVDYTPRVEAGWKIESLVETFVKKEFKYGIPLEELPEEYLDRPSDKYLQYIGSPILQLRQSYPLPELIELKDANIFGYSVPVYQYDPHVTLGYEMARRHVTNIPGFWPGDEREFSFLSYHFSNHIKQRSPSYGTDDARKALQSQAIFASFGWLMPLACYQGFSSYQDVTYPLITQTVLTDGREFTFAVYQLNTTELYHKRPFENVRCNICWVSATDSLYEVCEDGKLKGFNEEVLTHLLHFYLNVPKARHGLRLKPYLGDTIKHVADYEDDEKRTWLEKKFKQFSGNKTKPRPDYKYEVQDWERIYKIQFRMRPRDPRRRPFELRQNPFHRKMSEDKGHYIPKSLRPDKDLPKWRQKRYARTYYPE